MSHDPFPVRPASTDSYPSNPPPSEVWPAGHFDSRWENLARASGFRAGEMARACNVSLRTLQRHFKKKYQRTITEWLRDVRMAEAHRLICEGQSIKGAAYNAGYKQPSNFTREFKNYYGFPPRVLAKNSVQLVFRFPPRNCSISQPQG